MPGLDINWFRKDKGFDPDVIKKSLERRYRDPKLVDDIIEKDNEWRKSNPWSIQSDSNSTCSTRIGTLLMKSSSRRRRRTRRIHAWRSCRRRRKTN